MSTIKKTIYLRALEFLRDNPGKLTFEIARGLGLERANKVSFIHTFKSRGYVEQRQGKYYITEEGIDMPIHPHDCAVFEVLNVSVATPFAFNGIAKPTSDNLIVTPDPAKTPPGLWHTGFFGLIILPDIGVSLPAAVAV